jgi:hypothetical protein
MKNLEELYNKIELQKLKTVIFYYSHYFKLNYEFFIKDDYGDKMWHNKIGFDTEYFFTGNSYFVSKACFNRYIHHTERYNYRLYKKYYNEKNPIKL